MCITHCSFLATILWFLFNIKQSDFNWGETTYVTDTDNYQKIPPQKGQGEFWSFALNYLQVKRRFLEYREKWE